MTTPEEKAFQRWRAPNRNLPQAELIAQFRASQKEQSQMAKKEQSDHLPGMEPKRDPEIDRAANKLNSCLDALGDARGKKNDAEAKLIEILIAKGFKPGAVYRNGKVKVKLNEKMSVNVREMGAEDKKGINPADDDDSEDEDLDDDADEDVRPKRLKDAEKSKLASGRSPIADGLQELADEGPQGDELKQARKAAPTSKLAGYKRSVPDKVPT